MWRKHSMTNRDDFKKTGGLIQQQEGQKGAH